jgi:hypothetical protein
MEYLKIVLWYEYIPQKLVSPWTILTLPRQHIMKQNLHEKVQQ